MAFQVSPGVNITELDLTAGVQAASLSVGAFVGAFNWGPALDSISIASETELVSVFGKPDSMNYEYWFSAQSFLTYSNQLRVVRAISSNALNATSEAKTTYGIIGVKVWVYKGDTLGRHDAPVVQEPRSDEERRPRGPRRDARPTGDRPPARGTRRAAGTHAAPVDGSDKPAEHLRHDSQGVPSCCWMFADFEEVKQ